MHQSTEDTDRQCFTGFDHADLQLVHIPVNFNMVTIVYNPFKWKEGRVIVNSWIKSMNKKSILILTLKINKLMNLRSASLNPSKEKKTSFDSYDGLLIKFMKGHLITNRSSFLE